MKISDLSSFLSESNLPKNVLNKSKLFENLSATFQRTTLNGMVMLPPTSGHLWATLTTQGNFIAHSHV